ncbi:MAG: retroviral-like aspartic protease family protein [Candidatus Cloacimonetes bacterium]|nr:retroviral-like aspartic protease family protein [Candidatus Cloacimonadota bacterium]
MGEVKAKIKLTNFGDIRVHERDLMKQSEIRKLNVEMLVDTGATMLTISEDIAEKLGIKKEKEILVSYADESIHKHYKGRGVLVEIGDRDCVTDCVILERGTQSLLGQIPLEEMDLVVDYKNHQLIPNPKSYKGKVVVNLK